LNKGHRAAALVGLARSLLIYYAIPGRQRAWRCFYRQFISPGDLCFDVGAHVGNRTAALMAIGARVVAVEPQPLFASTLSRLYGKRKDLTILPVALGATAGRSQMLISSRNPTVSTMSLEWAGQVGQAPGFAMANWDQSVEVEVTTLDRLVAEYGKAVYIKLDVEGFELDVLLGLSQPVQLLSFEYLPPVIERTLACLNRLTELGDYRYNLIESEFPSFAFQDWVSADEIGARLTQMPRSQRSGEVFAREMVSGEQVE
jgi:FkbM family methyltransferase